MFASRLIEIPSKVSLHRAVDIDDDLFVADRRERQQQPLPFIQKLADLVGIVVLSVSVFALARCPSSRIGRLIEDSDFGAKITHNLRRFYSPCAPAVEVSADLSLIWRVESPRFIWSFMRRGRRTQSFGKIRYWSQAPRNGTGIKLEYQAVLLSGKARERVPPIVNKAKSVFQENTPIRTITPTYRASSAGLVRKRQNNFLS